MRPRKRFAQHFLEPAWITKVIDAIDPHAQDRILEIGPGRGALTVPLATRVDRLMAIEIDRDLSAALVARQLLNVTVVTGDVLDVDLVELARTLLSPPEDLALRDERPRNAAAKVRVVGNLPYNVSSPILFRLLDASARSMLFSDAILMLQKEVADRLGGHPGTKDYGVLAILTALGADLTRLLNLPPGAFRPVPQVRSAVVRLAFRPPNVAVQDRQLLVDLVRTVFTQRRKMLLNALRPFAERHAWDSASALQSADLDATRRPETLQLVEFARLADAFTTR